MQRSSRRLKEKRNNSPLHRIKDSFRFQKKSVPSAPWKSAVEFAFFRYDTFSRLFTHRLSSLPNRGLDQVTRMTRKSLTRMHGDRGENKEKNERMYLPFHSLANIEILQPPFNVFVLFLALLKAYSILRLVSRILSARYLRTGTNGNARFHVGV